MTKAFLVVLVLVLLSACGSNPTPEINLGATYVAGTVAALDSAALLEVETPAPEPAPTLTPVPTPTQKASISDQISSALNIGYCPEKKAREAIAEIRRITKQDDEENSQTPTTASFEELETWEFLADEADRKAKVEAIDELIRKMNKVDVPDCLFDAKLMYLRSFDSMKAMIESYNIGGQNDDFLSGLFKLSIVYEAADAELQKIESCLPNCEKP